MNNQEKNETYYANLFRKALEEDTPIYSTSNPNKRFEAAEQEAAKEALFNLHNS